jgi:uncharacterized membrane protein YfcA
MPASAPELFLLIAAGFLAGIVDAIGGGGGLFTLPALLASGLGPHAALATNKGQSCLGALSSLATYLARGGLNRERLSVGLISGFLGSLAGALLALAVSPAALRPLVLVLLLFAAGLLLFKRRLSRSVALVRFSQTRLGALGLSIGAYDGFFGPGTGTLLIAAFAHFFGDSPTRASGNAKIVNFGSNLAALIVFQLNGSVLWELALPMGLSNVLGASLGARLALRHGDRLVQGVALSALLAISAKLLFDLLAR